MQFLIDLLLHFVQRLGNVVRLRPVNFTGLVFTATETKQIQTVGYDTTTEREGKRGSGGGRERDMEGGRERGEREGGVGRVRYTC